MNVKPTATWQLENATAMMWGCPTDWRTARLEKEGDQEKAPEVIELLCTLAIEYNVQRISSPNVSDFNSRFLSDTFQYPWKLSLPGSACKLHRGLRGDGFEIHRGDAGIIAPADCAVIVVTTPSGRVLMLHAGRDSLVDRAFLNTGIRAKPHESIIFAAWDELCRVDKEDARLSNWHILPSISAGEHFKHDWDDPKWGASNQRLVNYITRYKHDVVGRPKKLGVIDVAALIAAQLTEFCGLSQDQITSDGRCTYKEVAVDSSPIWHSNARAIHTGSDPKARNLVVVINKRL